MSRFFQVWMGLSVIATVVTYAVSLVVFRHLDLTFTQFAILLVAPAAQAAVLTWPAGTPVRVWSALTEARRHPLASPVLLLDVVLLAAGVAWWSSSTLGFGAPVTAQTTWIGVKALAAAALCSVALQGVPRGVRAGVGLVLLLIAAQALGSGVERVYMVIDSRAQAVPEVVLRLLFYSAVYGGSMAIALRVTRRLGEHAAVWLTAAIALTVPAVLLVLLSFFNHPGVVDPWRGLALVCASAAVTALMLVILTLASEESVRQ